MQTMIDIEALVDTEIEAIATEIQRQEQIEADEKRLSELGLAARVDRAAEKLRKALGDDIYQALKPEGVWGNVHAMFTIHRYDRPFIIEVSDSPGNNEFRLYRQRQWWNSMQAYEVVDESELWEKLKRDLACVKDDYVAEQKWITTSTEIEAKIQTAVEEAKKALWQFPNSLTLYFWRWVVAGEESGWSVNDFLDMEGYIEILSKEGNDHIRLSPSLHRPVMHRKVFTSTDQLPKSLREVVEIEIPGVKQLDPDDDGMEGYSYDKDSSVWVEVGEVPIASIREFVDASRY